MVTIIVTLAMCNYSYHFLQDWDRQSNPLVPKGEAVKFPGKPCEKIQGTEGQTIYIQLDVEGSPPPTVDWFKVYTRSKQCEIPTKTFPIKPKRVIIFFYLNLKQGFKDLAMESRFKFWTDGATGQVVLGIEKIKQEDEGAYKCVLNDEIEHVFSVYVTGMIFSVKDIKE